MHPDSDPRTAPVNESAGNAAFQSMTAALAEVTARERAGG